jgi:prepilin signal peptidase PulO-like enzyme (type II secretory pathway)
MVNQILVIIFGLVIGSFLNVVIFRLAIKKTFIFGRSACPYCGKTIVWYDNIPLLSYLVLRGKCRHCHKNISLQYPLVELATAGIFLLLYLKFGFSNQFFANVVFCLFLLFIFVYDLKYYLILDKVVIPAIIIALVFNLLLGHGFVNLFWGAIIGGSFFALQFFLSGGKWVGDGDIRLGLLMGVLLGWRYLLVALFLAYLIGAVFGVFLIISKKKEMSSAIPFGPFLTLATFITMLYGQPILSWYLNLIYQ